VTLEVILATGKWKYYLIQYLEKYGVSYINYEANFMIRSHARSIILLLFVNYY